MATNTGADRSPTTADLVFAYSNRFTASLGPAHGVASPLGAWLLLALLAPAAGDEQLALESELGTSAADARTRALALLTNAHPAVASAAAVWWRTDLLTTEAIDALSTLPNPIEVGQIPTAAEADEWASRHTRGLVKQFPVASDELTAAVLANSLATEVSWSEPFNAVEASELRGKFGGRASQALRSQADHICALMHTEAGGLVGVHTVDSADGLRIVSVIADQSVPPAAVHAASGEVARGSAVPVSLFDLPLGTGHAWSISERTETVLSGGDYAEHIHALLVPWSAQNSHDLSTAPGVASALDAMARWLRPGAAAAALSARQSATASFSRTGFKAAAVTAFGIVGSAMPMPHQAVVREAMIRFNRPYAVVAVALDPRLTHSTGPAQHEVRTHDDWHGVPVFSAWVSQPD